MDTRGIISIDVERNGSNFSFHMPIGVKYMEAYDAAFEVLQSVLKMAQDATEAHKRQQLPDADGETEMASTTD